MVRALSNGSLSKHVTEAETLVERILASVPEADFLLFDVDLNTRASTSGL